MIRLARWVPLSVALHAATLGGVWRTRDLAEPALFVDMTLMESETQTGREAAPGPPARVPSAKRSPARGSAAQSGPPARAVAPQPDTGRVPAPPMPTPSPPPATAAPSAPPPPAPSAAVAAPPVTPAPTAAPTTETTPIAPSEPGPSAPQSPAPSAADVSAPSAADGSGAGDSTASRPGPGAGAGEPTDRGGRGVGVPTPGGGGSGAGASGDGPLALAIPGDGGAGVYGPYLTALRRRLLESLEYPMAARRRGLSGTVHLEIAIDATGRLSEVLVVRSSSHALLDDAALQAARSLRRVPFPPNVRPRPLRVLMPVVFDLR